MVKLSKIEINGDPETGQVEFSFANVGISFHPEDARRVAFALMEQADRAERHAAPADASKK